MVTDGIFNINGSMVHSIGQDDVMKYLGSQLGFFKVL